MSTILQWNARSIVANRSEFRHFLSQQPTPPDIICIQKTFLNKNNTTFKLDGYMMERADHQHGKAGVQPLSLEQDCRIYGFKIQQVLKP